MAASQMTTKIAEEIVLSRLQTFKKPGLSNVSEKLFKYQRVMPRRDPNNGDVARAAAANPNTDIFIVSFVVDIVFTVCRQFLWAASHIVTKEKFKNPMDNLREQTQLLGVYEHKIRLAINERKTAKVSSDFLEDVRQLRQDSEAFLEQLEQKWYINLWLHEREILEEFQSIQVVMEEVKSSIIDALLSCVEMESLRIRGGRMAELRDRSASNYGDYHNDDISEKLLVSWDQM